MEQTHFATVINCIDGRVQDPVAAWIRERFEVAYVDTITEPGPDKVLSLGPLGTIDAIREKVKRSIKTHNSRVVAIAGHHDCAANPVPREEHRDFIKQAVERVVSWQLLVRVVGLWVNERWRVEVVCDSKWTRPGA